MTADLFLEIGMEEIPAGFLTMSLDAMENILRQRLDAARIHYGSIKTLGTPRRLAIIAYGLADKQEDIQNEITGPPVKAAYDKSGNPTKAALGFAKSHGVEVDALKTIATEKGEYIFIKKLEKGRHTFDILQDLLLNLIMDIPFPKSMRWNSINIHFARPIQWIAALFNTKIIPFTIGNINSGDKSYGHRFMSHGPIKITGPGDYESLLKKGFVIPDPEERREIIIKQASELAEKQGGRLVDDPKLKEELPGIVEYPTAVCGRIDKKYLELPDQVLIMSMREHQRYFAVEDKDNNLLPYFITIANTRAKDMSIITMGNERVLRARLEDAIFFFNEDKKIPLDIMADKLNSVVFHTKLGTVSEKAARLRTNARIIAEHLKKEDMVKTLERAAKICKADLVSGMVGEFPLLQGVMGREYALIQKESPAVADAIPEHYLPLHTKGRLPLTLPGAILSIADKIDTICGCFAVGLIPSGTADPYALRRQAVGIINIIIDKKFDLEISMLIEIALERLKGKADISSDDLKKQISGFFRTRLQYLFQSNGHAVDFVDAVLETSHNRPLDAFQKINALAGFRENKGFELVAGTFKRVANIIRKQDVQTDMDDSLFLEPAEQNLYKHYMIACRDVQKANSKGDFLNAMETVSRLREPVDTFFDHVLVMADNPEIKNNRVALLKAIHDLFGNLLDFTRITT